MKRFRITQPTLPTGVTITTIDWYVNNKPIFDSSSLFTLTTVGTVTYIDIPLTIGDQDVFYGFVKFTLSDNTVINSDIVTFTKNDKSKVLSDEVYPPVTKAYVGDGNVIVIDVEPPKFFYGKYKHTATSYRVRTDTGYVLYERLYDVDNLYQLEIDKSRFDGIPVLVLEVKQEFENLEHDNWSRQMFVNESDIADIYISNDVLYNFEDTNVQFIYNSAKYFQLNVRVESLTGETIIDTVTIKGYGFVVPADMVKYYRKVVIKVEGTAPNRPTKYYEKKMRVVDYTYINPNNDTLPYTLPFQVGV